MKRNISDHWKLKCWRKELRRWSMDEKIALRSLGGRKQFLQSWSWKYNVVSIIFNLPAIITPKIVTFKYLSFFI